MERKAVSKLPSDKEGGLELGSEETSDLSDDKLDYCRIEVSGC